MLLSAFVVISFAFLLYSVSAWALIITKHFWRWNLILFWIGFVFDCAGAFLMSAIAGDSPAHPIHAVAGVDAMVFMLLHTLCATIIYARKHRRTMHVFHKFTLLVWIIWLIPFCTGLFMFLPGLLG
ncbi:membrane protein [Clostridia bacterium]|nr:membrane protein [Clostridia bacterium]